MKSLICLLGVLVAVNGALLGTKKCTTGPSYWCASLENAKECGATQHCLKKIWPTMTASSKVNSLMETEPCTFCKDIVSDVKGFLLKEDTLNEVEQYLKKACNFMPDDYSRGKCNEISEHYLEEFVGMVNQSLNADLICQLVKLCPSSTDGKSMKQHTLALSLAKGHSYVRDEDWCADCKTAIADAKAALENKDNQAELKKEMEDMCEKFGGLYKMECKILVETMFDKIIAAVDSQLTDDLCTKLGLCSSSNVKLGPISIIRVVFTTMVKKNALQERVSQVGADDACTMCEEAVNYVKLFVNNNETAQEVESLLETEVCAQLGELADMCKEAVKQYFPEVWAEFIQLLDPKTLCTDIGLCTSAKKIFLLKPSLVRSPGYVGGDDVCADCKTAIADAKAALENKDNQAELKKVAEDLCVKFGGKYTTECKLFVETMFDKMIAAVDSQLTDDLCTKLGLCSSSNIKLDPISFIKVVFTKMVKKNALQERVSQVGADDACTMCEEAVNYVKLFVNNNETEQEIQGLLENEVCAQLGEMESMCKELVEQYFPQVWAEFIQLLDPKTLCTELGLCTATKKVSLPKARASPQCLICEFVIEKLESELISNATEAEIVAAVEKVCSLLPSSVRDECNKFIDEYGKAIIHLLIHDATPGTICSFIGLCAYGDGAYMRPLSKVAGEECSMCELAMTYAKTFITENSTKQEIMNALDKMCNYLSGDMAQKCNSMVNQYAPQLLQMLADNIDGQKICTAIGLCTGEVDGRVHLYNRRSANI